MSRILWKSVAIVAVALLSPRAGHAQAAPSLVTLATPARSEGSCRPAPPPLRLRRDAPVTTLRGRQLVLTTGDGWAGRQLSVYTDARGRAR